MSQGEVMGAGRGDISIWSSAVKAMPKVKKRAEVEGENDSPSEAELAHGRPSSAAWG